MLPPFRSLVLGPFFCLIVGCSSASAIEAQYAPTNASNLNEASARTMKSFRLEPIDVKLIGEVDESGYDRGRGSPYDQPSTEPPKVPIAAKSVTSGTVRQWEQDKPVQFVGAGCMIGSSCGCSRRMEYRFAKAKDGSIWILVPVPEKNVHTSYSLGSCSYGCGQPSPPTPSFLFELPVNDIHKVRSVDVPFELHVGRESCLNPMPAP